MTEGGREDFESRQKREKEWTGQLVAYWQALAPDSPLSDAQKADCVPWCLYTAYTKSWKQWRLRLSTTSIDVKKHQFAWDKLSGICKRREIERDNPELAAFQNLYNIVRLRLGKANNKIEDREGVEGEADEVYELLELAQRRGVELRDLQIVARSATSLQQFHLAVIERTREALDRRSRPDLTIRLDVTHDDPPWDSN